MIFYWLIGLIGKLFDLLNRFDRLTVETVYFANHKKGLMKKGLNQQNILLFGPRQANLVLIAYASSEGSGEPAQSRQNLRCSLI